MRDALDDHGKVVEISSIAWFAALTIALAIAAGRGGPYEKLGALALLIAAFATPLVESSHDLPIDPGTLVVDGSLLMALLALAIRSGKQWPLFAFLFQFLLVGLSLVRSSTCPLNQLSYDDISGVMSYPVVISLLFSSVRIRNGETSLPRFLFGPTRPDLEIVDFDSRLIGGIPSRGDDVGALTSALRLYGVGRESRRIAEEVIGQSGSLAAALAAAPRELNMLGIGERAVCALRTIGQVSRLVLRTEVEMSEQLTNPEQACGYLRAEMAFSTVEEFWVLFLNNGSRLIHSEVFSTGSARSTDVKITRIVERAIQTGASSIILAHNHPSGDVTASSSDIMTTRKIQSLASSFDIDVTDHFIISRKGYLSFKMEGLLG